MKCPTCGTFLGQKVVEYEKNKDVICNNPNLSTEEKDIELTKLINNLKLKRYCCKSRMMTFKDIVQFIVAVPTNN